MAYKINDTLLTTQPTSGQWIPRESIGIDGSGHAVYPAYREFELQWDLIDLTSSYQLQDFFDNASVTGTVSVDLPKCKDAGSSGDSVFWQYSGCVLREPEFDRYFESHRASVRLLIARIRTA